MEYRVVIETYDIWFMNWVYISRALELITNFAKSLQASFDAREMKLDSWGKCILQLG